MFRNLHRQHVVCDTKLKTKLAYYYACYQNYFWFSRCELFKVKKATYARAVMILAWAGEAEESYFVQQRALCVLFTIMYNYIDNIVIM